MVDENQILNSEINHIIYRKDISIL